MAIDYEHYRTLTVEELVSILQDKDQLITGLRGDYAHERDLVKELETSAKINSVRMAGLRRQFADYSQTTAVVIDGLTNVLEAFEDVLTYDDGPREVVKFIKAFVARERRRLPKWIVKAEGYLSIDDEIPF